MKFKILIVLALLSANVLGQDFMEEEVIVTGIRASASELPGVTLKKKGDFLLLNVKIVNDTRDLEERKSEIYKTIKTAIALANKDKSIQISVAQGNLVLPLTKSNYEIDLVKGKRQDTSEAQITFKARINENMSDASSLVVKLKKFVKSVPVVGRVELIPLSEVNVSVVNPAQYRNEILGLVAEDINFITDKLGQEYKVVLEGINQPVMWSRAGPLHLSLYIPYSYTVVPESIKSILPADY
ncbi:hypothetical protein [Teredinibacter purpureus]|uniref:hypothetical protein n=1 Tax=Teredinibacter purpureus TaxID=2731756 RepID=UPI0005F85DB1|nr:hypothetical protein [Teredinibacter purpureus]